MDYTVALIVYIASFLGIIVAMYGMIAFRDDRKTMYFMMLNCCAFLFTLYIGGTMVQAVS